MGKYKENESYMHKHAKQVLKQWLDGAPELASGWKNLAPVAFRSNRKSGVFLEYPVCKNECLNSWDCNWDELTTYDDQYMNEYVPTYDECVRTFNCHPIAVIDVVVSHKGKPEYAIEVKHKHPVPVDKINKLRSCGIQHMIEIQAEWILKQTKRPDQLQYCRLI